MIGVGRAQTASREVADIIRYAADHPEAFADRSSNTIRKDRLEAFQTLFAACFTEIDILSLNGKSSWKAPMADVGKMLVCLANRDADWATVAQKVGSAERVDTTFYHDEFTGGNVVALDPSRKVLIAYLHFNDGIAICGFS